MPRDCLLAEHLQVPYVFPMHLRNSHEGNICSLQPELSVRFGRQVLCNQSRATAALDDDSNWCRQGRKNHIRPLQDGWDALAAMRRRRLQRSQKRKQLFLRGYDVPPLHGGLLRPWQLGSGADSFLFG